MIQIINLKDASKWNSIVKSFAEYDVYYLSGYVKAFEVHGDGTPQLLYYENNSLRAIYVFMKRPTEIAGIFDSITPYGYGGFLFEGDINPENLKIFWSEYVKRMDELNIIDSFVRYHPVLKNAEIMKSISEVIDLGKTVAMDLTSEDVIWTNIVSKNRNMIRKAEKNGVEIFHSREYALFENFIEIYNSTMDNDNADEYYYFSENFYKSIHEDLKDNYEMFYAVYENKIIAMSIIIFANTQMHYHLSGSLKEYRSLAPSNLLLYKAAIWGCKHGFKTFHLGGGVGSGEDSLYKFKVAFNRNSDYHFSIAKHIFNNEGYERLVNMRIEKEPNFDKSSNFFPLYRS